MAQHTSVRKVVAVMRLAGVFAGIILGILVTMALFAFRPAEAVTTATLESTSPIVVHYEDASGTPVLPSRTMPLYQYVESGDKATLNELHDLEHAIEADLHAKDPRFHRTHEFIDGRNW